MLVIAIESSHDDTSLAVVRDKEVVFEKSLTQTEFHKKFGGTVPEFAARKHVDNFAVIIEELKANVDFAEVDHIAYTALPGLIGSLHIGQLVANAIGLAFDIPVKKINHMYAHIYAVAFENTIEYPAVSLIASGGHTQLWLVNNPHDITLLGETKDDAAGEVFDKVARRLNLGFPGGPRIEEAAKSGQNNIDFRIIDDKTLDFSFSGLKTKVTNYINNKGGDVNDVAHSFQEEIVSQLISKTKRAIEMHNPKSIILGGGVAANTLLRERFATLHDNALIPSRKFTTDNAMMIGIRSIEKTNWDKK